MNVFLDTEFSDLVGIVNDPKLISIGLITEDGQRSFYAELSDNYEEGICSTFVLEAVLPELDAGPLPKVVDFKAVYARMTREECRIHLGYWIATMQEPVMVLSDAPGYDWQYVQDLFYGYPLPAMLEPKPIAIYPRQDAELHIYENVSEKAYSEGYRRHHALDDAKVMRLAWIATQGK